jgi:hypothetical protein
MEYSYEPSNLSDLLAQLEGIGAKELRSLDDVVKSALEHDWFSLIHIRHV